MPYVGSASQNTGSVSIVGGGLSATFDIGSRSNGLLVIGVYGQAGADIGAWTSPTWNGVPMTPIAARADGTRNVALFALHTPANGSNTFNVLWTDTAVTIPSTGVFALWGDDFDSTIPHKAVDAAGATDPSLPFTGGNAPTINGCMFVGFFISEANNPLTADEGSIAQQIDYGPRVVGMGYFEQTTAAGLDLSYAGADDTWLACGGVFAPLSEGGSAPTITPDTADESVFPSLTPTLLFTGEDADSDDLRYQVQVTDNPDDFSATGIESASFHGGSGGSFHPQVHGSATSWLGDPQVDDRPGVSFEAAESGWLKLVRLPLGDFREDTDGTAYVRIYAHAGTFGTSSTPANPAAFGDTPTPGWLAKSDGVVLFGEETPGDYEFAFTGANRIWLSAGTHYVLVMDWVPNDRVLNNTFAVTGDVLNSGALHGGNWYNDGFSENNNGIETDWDLHFDVEVDYDLVDALSGTDPGFVNQDDGGDSDPFTAGEQIGYTLQSDLNPARTYRWRVRVVDPDGENTFSDWTTARTFTVGAGDVGIGLATGVGTVIGFGTAVVSAAGSAAGQGAATGVGRSTYAAAGSAAGTGAASGVGASTYAAAGAASGTGAASGAGAQANAAQGAASGTGAASGVGRSIHSAEGQAAGAATVSGISDAEAVVEGAGSAAGTSTASGVGRSVHAAAAAASGAATVEADSQTVLSGVGSASGLASVEAAGRVIAAALAMASGSGAALGVASWTQAAVGSAAGVGAANAIGVAVGQVLAEQVALSSQGVGLSIESQGQEVSIARTGPTVTIT